MSRFAAIDTAVRLQLLSEGKTQFNNQTMDAMFRHDVGGTPVYDPSAVKTFLLNVANRLRLDDPPLKFAWNDVDPLSCQNAGLPMLVSIIEVKTNRPQPVATATAAG